MADSTNPDPDLVISDFREALSGLRSNTHDRDVVRSVIARRMLWLISILSVGIVAAAAAGCLELETAKDLALAFVAPIVGVFATVVGFFFGAEKS